MKDAKILWLLSGLPRKSSGIFREVNSRASTRETLENLDLPEKKVQLVKDGIFPDLGLAA